MSSFARHPQFNVQQLSIGRERAPLVVVDNLVADAEALVDIAASKTYGSVPTHYPGIRAKVPLAYQHFILEALREPIDSQFGPRRTAPRFTACHFSIVTTPRESLSYLQRIPHADSLNNNELAFVHYLFRSPLGGTAFYRHRKTGFEYVDQPRFEEYQRHLQAERLGPNAPPADYIHGDTPLYELLGLQEGVFNRLIVYRRTSLHSGVINPGQALDPRPRVGRLSVNGFLA